MTQAIQFWADARHTPEAAICSRRPPAASSPAFSRRCCRPRADRPHRSSASPGDDHLGFRIAGCAKREPGIHRVCSYSHGLHLRGAVIQSPFLVFILVRRFSANPVSPTLGGEHHIVELAAIITMIAFVCAVKIAAIFIEADRPRAVGHSPRRIMRYLLAGLTGGLFTASWSRTIGERGRDGAGAVYRLGIVAGHRAAHAPPHGGRC